MDQARPVKRDARGRLAKGVSLNPAGRPPGTVSIATELKRQLREDPALVKKLAKTLIRLFHAGHPVAITQVLNRVDGLVTQQIDIQRLTVVEVPMSELFDSLDPSESQE